MKTPTIHTIKKSAPECFEVLFQPHGDTKHLASMYFEAANVKEVKAQIKELNFERFNINWAVNDEDIKPFSQSDFRGYIAEQENQRIISKRQAWKSKKECELEDVRHTINFSERNVKSALDDIKQFKKDIKETERFIKIYKAKGKKAENEVKRIKRLK